MKRNHGCGSPFERKTRLPHGELLEPAIRSAASADTVAAEIPGSVRERKHTTWWRGDDEMDFVIIRYGEQNG
jgi:hypothetical protein